MTHDPVLLHVGYIKTATTFLQNAVFAGPDEGVELAAGPRTRAHMVEEILLGDDYTFDGAAARAHLETLAADVRGRGNLPVWSEEMLLGNPPTPRYDGFANARKLHATFPQGKVLITIRRQASIALSMYSEYVLGGGALPLAGFIGTGDEPPGYRPVLRPEFLEYDRAIRHYIGLFGADRVLVLPQELLKANPADFYGRLATFTGAPIEPDRARGAARHTGEGLTALRLRRLTNRLVVKDPTRKGRHGLAALQDRVIRRINRMAPAGWDAAPQSRMIAQIEARLSGRYGPSNARLAEMTGLPLGALGYEV